MDIFALHEQGLKLCAEVKTLDFRRIQILQRLSVSKAYQTFGKPSLFKYVQDFWDLPADVTYILIRVAKKAAQFSALQSAMEKQEFSVARAHRIASVLDSSNATELIEFAKTHTYKEIDREVARRNPKAMPVNKIKPISADYHSMQMAVDDEFLKILNRCKSVLAQKTSAAPSDQEALRAAMKTFLFHHDPVEKAKRAKPRHDLCAHPKGRRPLSAAQRHTVHRRDEGRCTHLDESGARCTADRWVDIHHKVQVKDGGSNDPENLQTLCWFHHDLVHQLKFNLEDSRPRPSH